jgi:photosystem II stability/assembly factor-like uncharacterized protein
MLIQLLKSMPFRNIGPSRGGRVVAVAGDPNDIATFYFGAVCGGVFKTTDAGITWQNISDGFFKTSSVGAIVVSPSDPNVIYVGMGEATIRTDVSYGDGVYKSTDAGKTWKHCGLSDTRHIGKMVVHPKNPDLVYVAALGHAFGENEERGVFRSKDGGKNWERVLFKSTRAGAVDITLDEHNPEILYATIWQTHRNFWELSSGGEDCGLWRTNDGGDTWSDISRNKGLEKLGLLGKIGVSASPARAGRVWALFEAKNKPGMYRSDDFGETWQLISELGDLRRRPFYYMHVHADPIDADTVYVNNLAFHKSTDGGKTWSAISTPHGDNHGLWIDPKNNRRMIQSNDGGANISFNGGETFGSIYNQLTGQIYQCDTDNQFPYRIYGTQQDNSSISVPSDTVNGAITWSDCYVAGTGESGYIAVKPDDHNIVVVGAVGSSPGGLGALQVYDHRTGQIQLINIWPEPYSATDPAKFKYRFPWTFPILFSPHDPNTLYVCGDRVFKSNDMGHRWKAISPDLTRNDKSKQKASGGPITLDTSGAEHYCTIFTFRESPHTPGVMMTGSDDGLVHMSRDGGVKWKNVTPKNLPEWSFIRTLEPSPHDDSTWYLAATRYKLDDFSPYVFVTRDNGDSWSQITGEAEGALPENEFVRVIRVDPKCEGVLYLGTELGLYVSIDDGKHWTRWEGFPVTPVYDIKIKDDDLIVATHGRGFWILDDLSALREVAREQDALRRDFETDSYFFTPATAIRVIPDIVAVWTAGEGRQYGLGLGSSAIIDAKKNENGEMVRKFHDGGAGRDKGVILYYTLPEKVEAKKISLEIRDAEGKSIRVFKTKPADYESWDEKKKGLDSGPWISATSGVNRFVWNLRHDGATRVPGDKTSGESSEGPHVTPGNYIAVLNVGKARKEISFELVNDPRVKTTIEDLRAQEKMLLKMRDKISDAHRAVNQLRDIREQVQAWKKRAGEDKKISKACDSVLKRLDQIEDALILPGEQKDDYHLISRTRLNAAIGSLISVVNSADTKPTKQSRELFEEMSNDVDKQCKALDKLCKTDVKTLNKLIEKAKLPAVKV